MDALSEILGAVRFEGAVYFNAEFSAPWMVRSPAPSVLAGRLGRPRQHVVIYHLLISGRANTALDEGPDVPLEAGDIVVFPHGDRHRMTDGAPVGAGGRGPAIEPVLNSELRPMRAGGGGEIARFVCGYMACDTAGRTFLQGLPPLFKVNIRNPSPGQWLENSIRFLAGQASEPQPGSGAVMARLSDALFVETLRRYAALAPAHETGWLAAARDPVSSKALDLVNGRPSESWTLEGLARAAGVSRSVLAERFQRHLGEPPMAYLTRRRMQLAAQRLDATRRTIPEIAAECGYRSEAAFNRAFKRAFGAPPARYRARTASPSDS